MSNLAICLVICALTMVSYIIGKLPMGLTALLSMLAFVLTGCLDPGAALGYFGNANGIMMVSMFVVAAGFNRTQFVKKCASSVNKISRGSLTMVMVGYILITVLLSQFIQSSVVVFGIMAPMMIASCEELHISPSKTLFPLAMCGISTISVLPLGSGATQNSQNRCSGEGQHFPVLQGVGQGVVQQRLSDGGTIGQNRHSVAIRQRHPAGQ